MPEADASGSPMEPRSFRRFYFRFIVWRPGVQSPGMTMVKKKIVLEKFDPGAVTMEARKQIGSDESVLCGIPVPSLGMQFLLNSTILPLARMIEIYGSPGAGKSTFLYEIIRWFLDAGGYVYLGETEQKDSTTARRAVCKWNADAIDRVTTRYDTTFEDWSGNLSKAIAFYSQTHARIGPTFPVLFGIDAVTSVESEKSVKEFAEEGAVQIAYAGLALRLSKLLRELNACYARRPFMLAFVNHVKEKVGSLGYGDNKTCPGGSALYFACHLILELTYLGTNRRANYVSRNIRIRVEKNGIQEKGKSIIVPVKYWTIPDPTNPARNLQQILYDWNTADIAFLLDQLTSKESGSERRRAIGSIIDLHTAKIGAENAVWSEALDIPESDPVPYEEAGQILHTNSGVFEKLQGCFITSDSVPFEAGDDFNAVLEQAKKTVDARYRAISDALYRNIVTKEMSNKEDK